MGLSRDSAVRLRPTAAIAAALLAMALTGASRGGGIVFPRAYEEIVAMWRQSGGQNSSNASVLETAEWTTLVVPFSAFGTLAGPSMTDDALSVARRELAKGRYGATLPYYRAGIGSIVVINDVRLAELEPTAQGQAREREQAGYLEHVRKVTLAAVLAHETTHALQFMRGDIYPGPGTLPYPGHDQKDELEAYLNINAIYESQLGLSLPQSRYEAIIRQDYSNLPEQALGFPERTRAFIAQRQLVDKSEGAGRPADFRDALARIRLHQERP
ncbi:MAG: hypothetical protein HY303_05855 [Candidatus Wallbacteria bacterium]|nr:hypothetical protein [Candidatus Wallbacteria bacterium]